MSTLGIEDDSPGKSPPRNLVPQETTETRNVDDAVVRDFGEEWAQFDQSELSDAERRRMFNQYFAIFPWKDLPRNSTGFDAGCGSGRWAMLVAPRVGHLHCFDPSLAINIAKKNLKHLHNCSFHQATVADMPLADNSMEFGYSIGVLHHVPHTQSGITACVRKLRRGAPFLVYLYYAFDNQPKWFRLIWKFSDMLRRLVSRLPYIPKYWVTQVLAGVVYFPLARVAKVLDSLGIDVRSFPLSSYRDRSFYSMRTDALDRFGTKLEKRFTRMQIQ